MFTLTRCARRWSLRPADTLDGALTLNLRSCGKEPWILESIILRLDNVLQVHLSAFIPVLSVIRLLSRSRGYCCSSIAGLFSTLCGASPVVSMQRHNSLMPLSSASSSDNAISPIPSQPSLSRSSASPKRSVTSPPRPTR